MYPHVTVYTASKMRQQGRPFIVRLEYRGASNTKSGLSNKFWQIVNHGSDMCEVSWGRLGSKKRRSHHKPWDQVFLKAEDKLGAGYQYSPSTTNALPPSKDLAAVGGPYAEISHMFEQPSGNFLCYDDAGAFLMEIPFETGTWVWSCNPKVHIKFKPGHQA